jgi:hypothetical protein
VIEDARARIALAERDAQIRDLQKQVLRAVDLRMRADERASRRNVYILNARIERLETELVRLWHRSSAVERRRLEQENNRLSATLARAYDSGWQDEDSE